MNCIKTLEYLKNFYAPFDPDRDTLTFQNLNSNLNEQQQEFEKALKEILEKGNFEPVTESDLKQAMQEESLFKVKPHVDFNDYYEVPFSEED